MKSLERILKLAERFERKISFGLAMKYAQQSSQPDDIAAALKTAGLFELSQAVAPLLSTVGISDDTKAVIHILVHKDLSCTYPVVLDPANPAQALKLAGAIRAKYGAAMKAALAKAGIQVTDTMEVNWLTF
jgi:hypothetical protein